MMGSARCLRPGRRDGPREFGSNLGALVSDDVRWGARMATTMKYYVHLNQVELAAQAVRLLSDPDAFGNARATPGNDPELPPLH